jgi:alkylation response protein AidB-like acyl-CoA dehydrogenase
MKSGRIMDLSYTKDDLAFRDEVQGFIREKFPPEIRAAVQRSSYVPKEHMVRWQKLLHDRGWIAPNWPVEYGGTGWTPMQKHIYAEEYQAADCPKISSFGITMVGPVIYTYGTEAQKKQHLPSILNSDVFWCQGYSEPGSGSDLASLQTKAVLDGDHYVVNGQKIWTSQAHRADWIFCLVRTNSDVKKQEGITFLLIDMRTDGVTVKPIISMDGRHYLNEVFFDDARVPVSNRIAEENKGWTYAKYLLGHERAGIAQVAKHKRTIERVREIGCQESANGAVLLDDPAFQARLMNVEVSLRALEITNLRMQANISAGKSPGDGSSTLKINGTQIEQELNEILVQALGYYGLPYSIEQFKPDSNEPPIGPDYATGLMADRLLRRAASIYGGSNEIQKNIIAKRILGL